jgi:hypothetical protein
LNRRALLAGGAACAVVGGAGALLATRSGQRCTAEPLTAADLDQAVALGGRYLVASQKSEGNFVYEVDWTTGAEKGGDNAVRQAGAVWGLALWHQEGVADALAPLDRALAWWRANRRSDDQGQSWLAYQTEPSGQMGTVALIGLALVDRLSAPQGLDEARKADWTSWLDEMLTFARRARLPAGGFADRYQADSGQLARSSNPYVDGELLLLLARAGRQLGRQDCLTDAVAWAPVDYERNVTVPRAKDPDPDTTKGYYQWGSMSWHQLAMAGHDAERLGGWLVELAHWMIDVHHTLDRRRNTAYAYEGILSAMAWARQSGDTASAAKFACTAHQGMRKLFSWQIGHPLAMPQLANAPERYAGGVQNEKGDPVLRIDVTQHQLHAAILARRYELASHED